MSWTTRLDLENRGSDSGISKKLEEALLLAANKGSLLFCSAPDEGVTTDGMFHSFFPVGCKNLSPHLFKIGAATATSMASSSTGDTAQLDFLLPGHEVTEKPFGSVSPQKSNPKSGSSIATALAAGFAALILHCVRLVAIKSVADDEGMLIPESTSAKHGITVTEESLKRVKTYDGMMDIFKSIPRGMNNNRYLEVDSTFDSLGKFLDNKTESTEEKMLKLTALVGNFLSWIR
ncbi:hypothetical protein F5Y11DRAFT_365681 [Daldinia sp. FL1419]|nr:hypothetical protein F5Y11DRAFT_365681 [Daldinia sp. FL1419]